MKTINKNIKKNGTNKFYAKDSEKLCRKHRKSDKRRNTKASKTYNVSKLGAVESYLEFMKKKLASQNVCDYSKELLSSYESLGYLPVDSKVRKDLRNLYAFTIDCKGCKDMDDAVSFSTTPHGYRLGVHIADVAAYVALGSSLDNEATRRSTSYYVPGRTVNMLPDVLCSDLCSLKEGEDRRTLSVIINLDKNGHVRSYEICKSTIKSRLKGVYDEIDMLLKGTASNKLMKKYEKINDTLTFMSVLAHKLRFERERNGALFIDNNKPTIKLNSQDIQLTAQKNSESALIIEEFMILANTLVAEYMFNNNLPTIYRSQGSRFEKAEYNYCKLGHANLALEGYVHFTSPIRRNSDLKTHQILSMHLDGNTPEYIHSVFDEKLKDVCKIATKRSRQAKLIEKSCEKYCYALHFIKKPHKVYTGTVIGTTKANTPIISIDKLNIKVKGNDERKFRAGKRVTFKVVPTRNMKDLIAIETRLAV